MGISIRTREGNDYVYFRYGKDSVYLFPVKHPNNKKNSETKKAVNHLENRIDKYLQQQTDLLATLPEDEREEYLSKKFSQLYNICNSARGAPDFSKYKPETEEEIRQRIVPEDLQN